MKFGYILLKNGQKNKQTSIILCLSMLEIGNNAELGKEYNGVETSLFGLKAAKHIIFYRIITKQEIEIIRILHERMDLKNSFD